MPSERTFAPLATLPALVLLLLALPPLVFGAIRGLQVCRGMAGLQRAEGRVVANKQRTSPDPEGSRTPLRSYYPVVSFAMPNGTSRQFTDSTGARYPQYPVGDTVEVLYDPARPSHALVRSWKNTWQEPATYLALGLLPLLILGAWGAWTLTLVGERPP